ncbi:cytochrome P450 [Mycobacterium sp.]|uniref:cytochrome P450 n=1 Tax=Mycobacterium sp. TaxID=1785 RepID=UPI003D1261FE
MAAEVEEHLARVGALISDPATYQRDEWDPLFALLRREDPVHRVHDSFFGPYWAITRFDDIREIEVNTQVFSSDSHFGGIQPYDLPPEAVLRTFFMMDPPDHTQHREVLKVLGLPQGVAAFEDLIRQSTREVLAGLPRGEEFDWTERVSIELTSTMLAAMMGYPIEKRHDLVYWSEVMTCFLDDPDAPISSEKEREAEKLRFAETMMTLWEQSSKEPANTTLLSILAHSDLMNSLSLQERMGTLLTFLVGGNDTTRNTMSGGLWALWEHPDELRKLRETPTLVRPFIQETLRWQTPALCVRRNALQDIDFKGKRIRKGDKVILWYISANRDDEAIERASEFIVNRERPSRHLTFGHGIHRCIGARLAEVQLAILWEEFFAQGYEFEVLAKPEYAYSSAFRAIRHLPVRITN